MQNTHQLEINMKDLLAIFREKIRYILLCTFIFAVAGFGFTKLFLTPQYQAVASLIVNARADATNYVTSSDVAASENLVSTYAFIIQSDTVLDKVIENLSLDMTYDQLTAKVSVSAVSDTQAMKVTVTDSDRERAEKITNQIIEVAPDIIIDKVKAGSVEIISTARASTKPVSPKTAMNTVFAGLLGFLIASIICLLKELLDTRVKSADVLADKIGVQVIGIIPEEDSKQ